MTAGFFKAYILPDEKSIKDRSTLVVERCNVQSGFLPGACFRS